MLKDIKAVIFDLDGTLVDSMWIWKQIDIDYLEKHGHNLPEDLQKDIEGMSFTETASYFKNRFNIKGSIEDIKAEWNAMALDLYTNKIQLKPHVWELLEKFKAMGLPMGIGTSNSPELAGAVVKAQGIEGFIEVVRTSCQVKKGKPAPDIFLKVAEDLNVAPEDCLVFEDTHAGVLAGKRAGMKVIAIYDDLSAPFRSEIEADADQYLESYSSLLDQLS